MEHKGAVRIRVDFPYNAQTIQAIKQLPTAKWSQSKKCWHLPYSNEVYALLQAHFDVSLPVNTPNATVESKILPTVQQNTVEQKTPRIPIHTLLVKVLPEHDFRVKVFVPYQQKDWIMKIKSLPNRAWNKEEQYWSVPKTKEVFIQLQQLFGNVLEVDLSIQWIINEGKIVSAQAGNAHKEIPSGSYRERCIKDRLATTITEKNYQTIKTADRTVKTIVGQKIIIEQENEDWLRVFVPYDKKGWIAIVKDIPGRKWQVEGTYWLIPYVQDSLNRLFSLIDQKYIQLAFELNVNIPDFYKIKEKEIRRKPSIKLNVIQQKALVAFEEKLLLENKAWRTRKTYKGLFAHFLAYFPDDKPSSISKVQIVQYIIFKKQDHISDSQLNQLINCLNCFFIRILKQEDKVIKLERPKKKRKLPNVFSLEEMELLLKAVTNLKHKCMLILVYSGGLRRSEVLNLGVQDLNFNRKTLFIKNAKGGKDRYTFFSDIAQKFLKEYLKQYQPKYYLFEGQTGGRYSETSLQSIYEKARKSARLSRTITLHGLRHSFATHMVEKGVPLHVVQELLGHSSIKTTEIYLHISNKFRKELKSPLDDLNI